jgi:hypothetical protein
MNNYQSKPIFCVGRTSLGRFGVFALLAINACGDPSVASVERTQGCQAGASCAGGPQQQQPGAPGSGGKTSRGTGGRSSGGAAAADGIATGGAAAGGTAVDGVATGGTAAGGAPAGDDSPPSDDSPHSGGSGGGRAPEGVAGTAGTDGGAGSDDSGTDESSRGFWQATGALHAAHSLQTGVQLADGRVLSVGGTLLKRALSSAEIYDAATNTWSTTASMSTPREAPSATLLPDGRVLVAGGRNGSRALVSAEIYNPAAGTWTAAADMPLTRAGHTASLLMDGRVLLAGSDEAASAAAKSALIYDPVANAWLDAGSMLHARIGATSTRLADGRVLISGGASDTTTAELYDPAQGSWSETSKMNALRAFHSANLLTSGLVLVVGGRDTSGALETAELYDPRAGVWTRAAALQTHRSGHGSANVAGGKVLVAGGKYGEADASSEVYDPASDSWSAGPELVTARQGHSLVALTDGRALAFGGTDANSRALDGGELYTPDASYSYGSETLDSGENWRLLQVTGVDDGTVVDHPVYVVEGATGLANVDLPEDIRAELQADEDAEGGTFLVNLEVVNAIARTEQTGELDPLLEPIIEPLDPPAGTVVSSSASSSDNRALGVVSITDCSDQIQSKTRSVSLNQPLTTSYSLGSSGQGSATISGTALGEAEVRYEIAVKRKKLEIKLPFKTISSGCVPYAVKPKSVSASGQIGLSYGSNLTGSTSNDLHFSKEVAKVNLGGVWLYGVYLGANVPLAVGLDLHQDATASVTFHGMNAVDASFDYSCEVGQGCKGSSHFDLGDLQTPDALTGSVTGHLKPEAWVQASIRGYFYTEKLAYAQIGVRPRLKADLWGYLGNECGDADADGNPETVSALTLDVDGTASLVAEGSLVGSSKEWELGSISKHLLFKDLLGSGSSAMSPMLQGPNQGTVNVDTSYSAQMRPCWPYSENVDYELSWDDGEATSLTGAPKQAAFATHRFAQEGDFAVGLTALRDGHGRVVGQRTSHTIEIGALPVPAGAEMWLRADAGIVQSGGKISRWVDQSGKGHDGFMPTAARQPTWVEAGLNQLPVVRFDGAQSLYLQSYLEPTAFSLFVVGKNDAPSGYTLILGPGGNAPNNQIRWENDTQLLLIGLGNGLPLTTETIGDTHVYHALALRYDGSTLGIYRDGDLVSNKAFSTTGPWTFAQLGAWFGSDFAKSALAEVIVYDAALPSSEFDSTSAYLSQKYALP